MGNISVLHPDQGDLALPDTHPAKGLQLPLQPSISVSALDTDQREIAALPLETHQPRMSAILGTALAEPRGRRETS